MAQWHLEQHMMHPAASIGFILFRTTQQMRASCEGRKCKRRRPQDAMERLDNSHAHCHNVVEPSSIGLSSQRKLNHFCSLYHTLYMYAICVCMYVCMYVCTYVCVCLLVCANAFGGFLSRSATICQACHFSMSSKLTKSEKADNRLIMTCRENSDV